MNTGRMATVGAALYMSALAGVIAAEPVQVGSDAPAIATTVTKPVGSVGATQVRYRFAFTGTTCIGLANMPPVGVGSVLPSYVCTVDSKVTTGSISGATVPLYSAGKAGQHVCTVSLVMPTGKGLDAVRLNAFQFDSGAVVSKAP